MHPEKAGWDRKAILIGRAVDALNWLVWAKTKDGHKNRNRPRSVLPGARNAGQTRPGSAPKPSPISKIKEAFKNRIQPSDGDREVKIGKAFGRR